MNRAAHEIRNWGFATTVFALLTIVTAPLAAASPDDDFLDALTRIGISLPPKVTPNLVNAGHAVCQKFATGASYQDVAKDVSSGLGGNAGLTGNISVATGSLW